MSNYYKNFKSLKILNTGQSNEVILATPSYQIQGLPQRFIIKKFFQRSAVPQECLIHKELYIKNKDTLAYYLDWFEPPFFYMSIEYCSGGDLKEFIMRQESENLPYSDILIWCHQLAKAVQLFHNSQICHRDIKLENIFITNEGKLKIGDFGEAKKIEDFKEGIKRVNQRQKLVFGKAKERMFNSKLDKGSPFSDDIWALGKVMFELMDGKCCFEMFSNKFVVEEFVLKKASQFSIPENFKLLLIDMLCASNRNFISIDRIVDVIDQLILKVDGLKNEILGQSPNLDHKTSMNISEDIEQNTDSVLVHYELKSIHSEDLNLACVDEKLIENLKKNSVSSSLDENSYYIHDDPLENIQLKSQSEIYEESSIPENENFFLSSRAIQMIKDLKLRSEKEKSINPNQTSVVSPIINVKTSKVIENPIYKNRDCKYPKSAQPSHRRSKTEFLKKQCSICEEAINDSEILNKCKHSYHNYCLAKSYNDTLIKADKKIDSLKCIRCHEDIDFEILCLSWFFSKEAYMNAHLQLFAHTKCNCPMCGANSDDYMLNEKLNFYNIKCKACKKKYCSFCGVEESHDWKSRWSCKYLRTLKKCKFVI